MASRVRRGLLAALLAATLLGGCAFDPASVPVPGASVSGPTYPIRIQFANALNLPARAKVMANGAQVGNVTGVTVVDPAATNGGGGYVVVEAEIEKSVRIPTSTLAQLRQNTVLGDIHIALATPPDGFGSILAAGGTIPRAQTVPATQIEDTMAGVATFVQGGAVGQFQEIVDRLNTVLPADPAETARISEAVGANAIDLAEHLREVDIFLDALTADSAVVKEMGPQVAELLTEPAVEQVSASVASIVDVVGVLGALGSVSHSMVWLAPLAKSGDAAARAFVPLAFTSRPLDLSAPSNLNALVALIRDRIIPFVERGPKVNIVGVTADSGEASSGDQVEQVVRALRMIGAVR
ncbi:virulence factor Mce family protein [Nocardia amikacinitolerans]|uniref:MlaD family protein n=1 Tax=Nocardia amikacinitolerans TaxID=756689 RepID=UPI0020A53C46|nr:MlaD family protein [Nocardia amikacinitolerans]MCP2297326.1 virulence factor Mce family protein [Nocardia amikacinitolerans]